jgi:hypothetical protein
VNCYVCDDDGKTTSAVAICANCHIGLCREHLDEDLLSIGPGGTRLGCSHDPVAAARDAAGSEA